jgi:hypothetical protein
MEHSPQPAHHDHWRRCLADLRTPHGLGRPAGQRRVRLAPPLRELVLPMTPRSETKGAERHQLAPNDVEAAVAHYRCLGVSAQMLRAYCAPTAEQAWIQRSRAGRG